MTGMIRPVLAAIRWPEVLAASVCMVGFALFALWINSYVPAPPNEQDAAAARALSLANCGAGLMDVATHDPVCPAYDRLSLEATPCLGDCEGFTFTLHSDGRAELLGDAPDKSRGNFEADIGRAEFRRIANLIALLQFDQRGGFSPPAPDAADHVLNAGCRGQWTLHANYAGQSGEFPALVKCLQDIRKQADWNATKSP